MICGINQQDMVYLDSGHKAACIAFDLRSAANLSDVDLAYEILRAAEPERKLPFRRFAPTVAVMVFEANRRGWWTMRFGDSWKVRIPETVHEVLDRFVEQVLNPPKKPRRGRPPS